MNFKIIKSIETEFGINITRYKSEVTGLTVILIETQEALVNGNFLVATEVFLGSELYPHKGVLDNLANRTFSNGTNAWTAQDNTTYTIQTAGSQGFLSLLPVYVDHILYPTLTESGCYTEVHHINGKGENAGGTENSNENLIELKYQRLMYPEGCGYRYETGGLMEKLRTLSVETIRQYHKDYYRPENLCLIITGNISHSELFKALDPIDKRISEKTKGSLPTHKRPFVDSPPIPLLEKSIRDQVEFPDEDENFGQLLISWLGPLVDEFLEIAALEVLHEYLSDSAVSVLQKEFVETEDPLCTDIDISISHQTRTAIKATFYNVPTSELDDLADEVLEVFKRIVESEGIDMNRMKTVLRLVKLRTLNMIETNPHSYFSNICILDYVYGKETGEYLERVAKDLKYYDQLSEFTEQQWIQYVNKYHLDNPNITILGKPSAKLAETLVEQEKKRTEKQIENLGPDKLKELEKRLEEAKKLNDLPIPPDIIENFPVPSVDSIPFINSVTGRNKPEGRFDNPVQKYLDQDSKIDIPYFIQYDHIPSAFVTVSLYINTSNIPVESRPYINLYLESFYSLPLTLPDGTKLTFEQVVSELNNDTVDYQSSLGVGQSFDQMIVFHIKVESNNYVKGIQWLRDLLWNTEFTAERLKVIATKCLNEIPEEKRDGNKMSSVVSELINFDSKLSNKCSLSSLSQERFLPNFINELGEDSDQTIQRFYQLRVLLTKPENLRIHVIGDILKLPNPKSVWAEHFKIIETSKPLIPVPLSQQFLTENGRNPGNQGYIVKLPSIESSFSTHITKGPLSFDSPDLVPLLVLCEFLDITEGLLWISVRGQGLAYGTWFNVDIESGHVRFTIYRSPDAFKAFEQVRKVVFDLAERTIDFDKSKFDGAKSSVIFNLVRKERNLSAAATESFIVRVLKNMDANYNKNLIAKILAIKIEDFYPILVKYLLNLFKPETSNVVVVSTPVKVEDIGQEFNNHKFHLKVKNLDSIIKNIS
ncbi:5030_t:CDS:10 [Funneliformis geosporum]|uniref:14130_t:CDS:1 n=1 Tax=Funneliformis geosporum TaxID=1117311 RepID=A0A9W4SK79_9GLOM|nr:5030_t:CDS:10 [Funneliformis geosporum]CAI2172410.1 14130_t:CDS:10 [Funneliformis geosporum]